ncbi:MAG TPA: APC family permease [Gemmataceae bacterium]|nr:APC family permease [Gemmataceae bacterium]
MTTSGEPATPSGSYRLKRTAQVIIVSSVMFTFISYWRTAAVVLCDLASTAYYIGGIVEQAIGPAAPWFILAVMIFSYAVRSVYIESCSLFIRGGVYRVVREALGAFSAKLAVSALIFDYLLTGPISGVSAGQYLMGLFLDTLAVIKPELQIVDPETRKLVKNWGAVIIACLIVLYFFRLNLIGIHESSEKALKIMVATTIMAAIMISWCLLTLAIRGPAPGNTVPLAPDLSEKWENEVFKERDPVTGKEKEVWKKDAQGRFIRKLDAEGKPIPKLNEVTGQQEDPLGFLGHTRTAAELRDPNQVNWLSIIGVLGVFIAFGHSILAMSGEETLAQVYREVESPKLPNFRKAAFIVFVYSLALTAGISFLAVLIIPDGVRMKDYDQNLISGLAMHVIGPNGLKLFLNAFVVIVGFLILSGAVNTAIIGSNGVLNRVAEDGVLPDWFRKPHPRYGTSSRILYTIVGLQLFIIIYSQGDVLLLGEAYAFGVVWSFVFQALAMVVLRFKDKRPREYKVPFNLRVGSVEIPFGLIAVLMILLLTAIMNLLTKEVATKSGLVFTGVFFLTFLFSEYYHEKRRKGKTHQHLEQFNQATAEEITRASLRLTRPYCKLVAIRSPQNLFMLEKALAETDPETTDVVVMTAKVTPAGEAPSPEVELDPYDQELMTAVVKHAEKMGKQVRPLIVPTNNPLHTVLRIAKDLRAQELIMGASNKYTADEQLEQLALYWFTLHPGEPAPLTVRILSRHRDVYLDLAGGSHIPKVTERQARTVAELRAAGVGVDKVLLAHTGTPESRDVFEALLTMLDPQVALGVVPLVNDGGTSMQAPDVIRQEEERAGKVGRELHVCPMDRAAGEGVVRAAREGEYDVIVLALPRERPAGVAWPWDTAAVYILNHAHCKVLLAAPPLVPQEVDET